MKKLIWFLLVILACSCSENKVQVAFLLPHIKNERYVKEKQYFTDRISQLGGTAIVVEAQNDAKIQNKQALDFLQKGIKVLVIDVVNADLAAEIVRQAHDYKAIIIAYDRLIMNSKPDYYISFKYQDIGYNMTEYALKLQPTGNYVVIDGDRTDFNAVQISKGQMKALEGPVKDGKVKILYNVSIEDWDDDNARVQMDYFLRLSDIVPDVIISSSDKLTGGILRAFSGHNIDNNIIITGMDAELAACKNIINGKQTVTVYKSFKKLAYTAAEMAMNCAKGNKINDLNDKMWNGVIDVPTKFIETVLVDKNNIKSTLIADGIFTEADIYGDK
jgi:D-xylose transport system substrate-binding protein